MIHIGEHETVAAKGENTPFHKKAQNSQNGNQKGEQIDIIEFPHTDLHGDTFTPYARMRLVGLEPTRLAAQEPKSCMSANSIITAYAKTTYSA